MIASIENSSNLDLFKTAITSQQKYQATTTETKGSGKNANLSAPDLSAQYYMEKFSQDSIGRDRNLIEAVAAAANSTEQVARGNALHEVERDTSYLELKWRESVKGMTPDIGLIESCMNSEKSMLILGCTDKSSTPENPIMYMETVENGVVKAYRVEINKIDLSDATLIEAFALSSFTQNGGDSFVTTNMLGCWTDLQTYAESPYPDSYQKRINLFDSVKKNFVDVNWLLSSMDKARAISGIEYIEKEGSSENALIQFLALRSVVDETAIAIDPNNRYNPNKLKGQTIESGLWAQGIDYIYPDGTKYSQHLYGTVNNN